MKYQLMSLFAFVSTVLFAVPCAYAASVSAPDQNIRNVHVSGVVVQTDGKPATNAVITFRVIQHTQPGSASLVQPLKVQVGGDGSFRSDFKLDRSKNESLDAFVTAPGEIALFSPQEGTGTPVVLEPVTTAKIRLVGANGNPIVGASVSPLYFIVAHGDSSEYVYWDNQSDSRWDVVTDSDGNATFTGLPATLPFLLKIAGKDYVQPQDKVLTAATPTAVVTDVQSIKLDLCASVSGDVTYSTTGLPAANIRVEASGLNDPSRAPDRGYAVTDASGHYEIDQLGPNDYSVEYESQSLFSGVKSDDSWTAVATNVTLKAGDSPKSVNLTLIHGATMIGTVTNKFTGKPDPGIMISSSGPDHPAYYADEATAMTGKDGTYTLRVAPGNHDLLASTIYGGVIPQSDVIRNLTITDGSVVTNNFVVPDPGVAGPVSGTVVGPNGRPVAGAKVTSESTNSWPNSAMTDSSGKFTFSVPGLFPTDKLYASYGHLISRISEPIGTLAALKLKLSPGFACTVTGQVLDTRGRPVKSANVDLFRQESDNGGGSSVDSVTTDINGKYIFPAELPGEMYAVSTSCAGYEPQIGGMSFAAATAGKTICEKTVTMSVADSFIGGTIVDIHGNPISGAKVADEYNQQNTITTDSDGKFYLKNVAENEMLLSVFAPEGRQTSAEEESGRTDLVVKIMNQQEQEDSSKNFVAQLDADATNHGDGSSAAALLNAAEKKASIEGKSVLLIFHASWCGPCFMLHRFLEDAAVKPIVDRHFVVQSIDIWENGKTKPWENPGGATMYTKYGSTDNGVPFTILLSASGKKLGDSRFKGQNMGVPTQPAEVAYFLAELKHASPALTAEDLTTLKDGLNRVQNQFN